MYGRSSNPGAQNALNLVKQVFPGAAKVKIPFSGGNDEGGPNGMYVDDAEGQTIGTLDYYEGAAWRVYALEETGAVVVEKAKSDFYPHEYEAPKVYKELKGREYSSAGENLTWPIDQEYGSFNGSPYVGGTLEWDLDEGTYRMRDCHEEEGLQE